MLSELRSVIESPFPPRFCVRNCSYQPCISPQHSGGTELDMLLSNPIQISFLSTVSCAKHYCEPMHHICYIITTITLSPHHPLSPSPHVSDLKTLTVSILIDRQQPNLNNPKQEDGGSKNAGLELLWTHRCPLGGDRAEGGIPRSGGSIHTTAACSGTSTAPHGGIKQNNAHRAPRSSGGEVGGGGALGGAGGGPHAGGGVAGGGGAGMADPQGRRDRTVTALCFHQLNGDVLAVGYGAFFFLPSVHKGGAVLFWSVRFCVWLFYLHLGPWDSWVVVGGLLCCYSSHSYLQISATDTTKTLCQKEGSLEYYRQRQLVFRVSLLFPWVWKSPLMLYKSLLCVYSIKPRMCFILSFLICGSGKVRNPEYPERTIRTHSSVTSLDFSERHPTLLAVGMYDGTTAIYDTAREGEVSVLDLEVMAILLTPV